MSGDKSARLWETQSSLVFRRIQSTRWLWMVPIVAAMAAAISLFLFFRTRPPQLTLRVPGTDQAPNVDRGAGVNPVLSGTLSLGVGQPADLAGAWPQFRGSQLNGVATDSTRLARQWGSGGPDSLWSIDVGEGYAGAVVLNGRVYLIDYDQENRQDAVRCLSLADGQEIWRFAYPVKVKRNHGMSRTVPAVTENHVVAIGPKCHVSCLDSITGQLRWSLDLVQQFGATIPPWYAGQCPLLDGEDVILAPGGPEALLLKVNLSTGEILWQSANPKGWKMTHSSIRPMEFNGERSYVYCASQGVVGVSAETGAILWENADWKISIATIASPVILPGGRIFLSGGYDAGSMMLQLTQEQDQIAAQPAFRLGADVFGATQQTPIYFQDHIFGVRPDGQLVCLTTAGEPQWTSGTDHRFGMGPFLVADGLLFVMNDSGELSLVEAQSPRFSELDRAKVLDGRESWGPMALAGGRLLVRDLKRLVCLDVARGN